MEMMAISSKAASDFLIGNVEPFWRNTACRSSWLKRQFLGYSLSIKSNANFSRIRLRNSVNCSVSEATDTALGDVLYWVQHRMVCRWNKHNKYGFFNKNGKYSSQRKMSSMCCFSSLEGNSYLPSERELLSGKVIYSVASAMGHNKDSHPECNSRVPAIIGALAKMELTPEFRSSEIIELKNFRPATVDDIASVHERAYISNLEKFSGQTEKGTDG